MRIKNILVLYHEDISRRFPAHYRKPFCKFLPDKGFKVRMVYFDASADAPTVDGEKIRLPVTKSRSLHRIPQEYFKTSARVLDAARLLEQDGFRPDLVISFNNPILLKAGQRIADAAGAKHVVHIGHLFCESKMRCPSLVEKAKGYSSVLVRNRILRRADQVWLMSEEMRSYFASMLPVDKLKVWPSAVDVRSEPKHYRGRRQEIRDELDLAEGVPALLYIGTLSKQRDLALVLDAMRLVLRQRPDAALIFLGYSPASDDLALLQAHAASLEIADNVVFHPPVDEDELPYYAAACDIGISPFKPNFIFRHNSPLKLLEYMNAGIPVAVSTNPEQVTIMAKCSAGRIFDWTPESFAACLLELIEFSPEERHKLGNRGFQWVRDNRDVKLLTNEMVTWLGEL